MMKKILLVLIFSSILILTGCNNNESSAEKIDPVIISLLNDLNYSSKGLTNKEESLIDNFIYTESKENKVVNLSKISSLAYLGSSLVENSYGVYELEGEYHIKYEDIEFEKTIDSEEDITSFDDEFYNAATIYFGGYVLNITSKDIPILYTDTKNNDRFNYIFINRLSFDDKIVSYYKSIYDDSDMQIIYNIKNNEIYNIEILYNIYDKNILIAQDSKGNILNSILIYIIILAFLIGIGFGVKKLYFSKRK